MDAKLTRKAQNWLKTVLDDADLRDDVKTKVDADGKYIRTPWALCEEIVRDICWSMQPGTALTRDPELDYLISESLRGKKILVVDTVEFIPVLLAFGAEKCNITYVAPYAYKGASIAGVIGVRVVQQSLLEWKSNMKFDVVVGNPPYQVLSGNTKVSVVSKFIKKFIDHTEDGGYTSIIAATTFLGGGQQGIMDELYAHNVMDIELDQNHHFPSVSVDVASILIKKSPSVGNLVPVSRKGKQFQIKKDSFVYTNGKPFVPKGADPVSAPILEKIISGKDVIRFQSSFSKDKKYKFGFWSAANIGIHPKYFKIANGADFGKDNITHPAGVDERYPEENLRSVFQGKIFHWVLFIVNGNRSDRNPSNLSYFPKVDLSKKWTFDTLAAEFGLTDDEKKVITDWASSRGKTEWFD